MRLGVAFVRPMPKAVTARDATDSHALPTDRRRDLPGPHLV